jgi:hypothetical protein
LRPWQSRITEQTGGKPYTYSPSFRDRLIMFCIASPTEVRYKDTVKALEDHYRDQMATAYFLSSKQGQS